MKKGLGLFERIYWVVCKIPKGKVATYGQVAKAVGIKDARKVGWALHANRSLDVPCHRVINNQGRLAPNFAFDGAREQRIRLMKEKVAFKSRMYVDLNKCLLKKF